jgi:flagellar basal body-associated protein FliL
VEEEEEEEKKKKTEKEEKKKKKMKIMMMMMMMMMMHEVVHLFYGVNRKFASLEFPGLIRDLTMQSRYIVHAS